jgi:hypothetical protein
MSSITDVERRMTPLLRLPDLAASTEEKLAHLNALAEHVAQKTKALEAQKGTLDRALLEGNRLNEMVWNMDVQVERLQEGLKGAVRSQEAIARVETLAEETEQKVDLALRMRNELARDVTRFERDGRALVQTLRSSLDGLAVEKKQIDTMHERLEAEQSGVSRAEARLSSLAQGQDDAAHLRQELEALQRRI